MGSKASDAPAPDPQLVQAQLKSMGIQDDAIQGMMANANAIAPYQREQLQFGLDTSRAAYNQSQDDRAWTLGKRSQLDAAQRPLLDEAAGFNVDERRGDLYGQASADITSLFDASEQQGMRSMGRMGVNASDGRMAAFTNQNNIQEALAKASAGRKVGEAARAEGMQLRSNAANMLAGYPSMGMQATGAGAGYGAAGLGLANQGLAGLNSGYGAAGSMAGQMGQNATGMYGAQAQYKLQSDQQAAANDPFGLILGAATGAATGWGLGKMFGK